MARKPRPVDPTEGPLQAFAHDLRAVREQAGNPTYRALATLAGFSASTLSDAAGGVRQPSLEVTLAYVGACGGDVELWERRWEELSRELAVRPAGVEAADTAAADATQTMAEEPEAVGEAAPNAAEQPAPAPLAEATEAEAAQPAEPVATAAATLPRRWYQAYRERPARRTLLTMGAVAAVCALLALWLPGQHQPHSQPQPPSSTVADSACLPPAGAAAGVAPATPAPVRFTATTKSAGAHVRPGASFNAAILWTVPPDCTLQLTGFCLGDVVYDVAGGEPDIRWYELAGGGLVASAVMHGDPPSALQPTPCADNAPSPVSVSLTMARSAPDGSVELKATGNQVAIVGYAAFFSEAPSGAGSGTPSAAAGSPAVTPGSPAAGSGSPAPTPPAPAWHQIQLSADSQHQFDYVWRLGPLQTATAPIPVVSVACLGGGRPTTVADAQLLSLSTALPAPAQLSPADRGIAERAACRYPNTSNG